MRKPTGQMQELTQEKLDDYNTLYCWEYKDMCDFIENHSELRSSVLLVINWSI